MLSKVDFVVFFPTEHYQAQQIPNVATFFMVQVFLINL